MAPTLANLLLTTPLLLGGLALLALPIAAHLLNRHAKRRLVFPTIEMLLASSASQSRLFKLRRLLLLLLRCLIVAAVVFAFTRPVWRDMPVPAENPDGGAAVVLVMDLSLSATQEAGGVSAASTLRAAAGRAIDNLESGADAVNLVLARARLEVIFPDLTRNLDAVREQVAKAQPSAARADLPAAIAAAGQILGQHAAPRHLVIVSDLQASNWTDVEQRLATDRPLPRDTRVTILPMTQAEPGNVALAAASAYPKTPLLHQPVQLAVKVANHSDIDRTVQVDLAVDGRPAGAQTLHLAPRQQREAAFEVTLDRPGDHQAVFTLPGDALAADNRAHLVLRAAQRLPVLIIADDYPDEPGSASYFLTRALMPYGGERDVIDARVLRGDQVTPEALGEAAAVLVGQTTELAPDTLTALKTYLESGGGVAIFAGDRLAGRNLQALDALSDTGLLPWTPQAYDEPVRRGEHLTIAGGDWQSSLLRDFDPRSQSAISRIHFWRAWTPGELRSDAKVLLRFSNGTPALAARHVGLGQLVVANFSPVPTSSDLGKYGSFVAIVHSLVTYLQPTGAGEAGHTVGEGLRLVLEEMPDAPRQPEQLFVARPDGEPLVAAAFSRTDAGLLVRVDELAQPGFYTVRQGEQPVRTAAVNVDERESDLRRLDPQALQTRLAEQGVGVTVHEIASNNPVVETAGTPLWGWFLLAALAALGLEMLLQSYWRK